ncbi:hypothetical protein PNOK_0913400 [Pyrrhoderma noxium]|uniref:Uncharacterized protein n=1 Tax=Pyrrhoderma noxium TaxID=2282107 RepID=A0A286U715_9AGAM|nr:hypothetical protein PNOK_0913400 [Pyrrhoderma noxium]
MYYPIEAGPLTFDLYTMRTSVDHTDPRIQYRGNWQLNDGNSRRDTVSSHSTSQNGSSLSLKFQGTGISVLGVLPVGTGNISALYTVDNQNKQLRSIPQVESSKTDKVFFDSGLLDSGDHSINIDIMSTGIDRNYTFREFHIHYTIDGETQDQETKLTQLVVVNAILAALCFFLILSHLFLYLRRNRRQLLNKTKKMDQPSNPLEEEEAVGRGISDRGLVEEPINLPHPMYGASQPGVSSKEATTQINPVVGSGGTIPSDQRRTSSLSPDSLSRLPSYSTLGFAQSA